MHEYQNDADFSLIEFIFLSHLPTRSLYVVLVIIDKHVNKYFECDTWSDTDF